MVDRLGGWWCALDGFRDDERPGVFFDVLLDAPFTIAREDPTRFIAALKAGGVKARNLPKDLREVLASAINNRV